MVGRGELGAEVLNDTGKGISELLPACFVCCSSESFPNTKFKKMKERHPKQQEFLKSFLPLTATLFFLLKIKKNKSQ